MDALSLFLTSRNERQRCNKGFEIIAANVLELLEKWKEYHG